MPPRGGVSSALAGLPLEYLSALRSYRFPPVELRRLQEKKLRILVEHAFNRVPYYHTIMRDRGLMPNDFKDADDLRRLPLLTKQVILTGGPQDFIARGVRVVDVRTTSGTTGPPVAFRRGPGTLERIVALRLRRMTMTGVRLWEKAVYLPYYGSDVSGIARLSGPRPGKAVARLSRLLARPRDLVTGYRVLPIGPGNVEAISRMLVRYRPSILRARPSYLRRIARVVKGFAPSFQASKIFTEGEVLTRGTRADLEASFNAQVFDEYGSTEHSGLGNECRHHNGIHLNVDYFIFEFLARDGLPAADGERAEIVVTGLSDDAMPLVRYRLGDYVVKDKDERCACGTYFSTLRHIEGRESDALLGAGGEPVPSGEIVEYLETDLGLRDFQLIQENATELLLRVPERPDGAVASSVRGHLSSLLGRDIVLRTEPWKEDEMPIKFRPVVRSPVKVAAANQVGG